ncbi:MAG: HD domain-containing phosphohydrolase [Dehalococcoidales bacterium]|jgi:response regulator RpfG family c-di-GMP phosphodiesterase/signal transduction histidine kinase
MNVLVELLNQLQLTNEINSLIEKSKTFAAIYLDIDIQKGCTPANDYSQDEQVIQLLADITREAVKQHGNEDNLIGYPGGDNLMVVTTVPKVRTLCRRILSEFDLRVKSLYPGKKQVKGNDAGDDEAEIENQSPAVILRAVAVTSENCIFQNHLDVISAAEEQLARLRKYPGLRSYFDLKKSDIPADSSGFPTSIVPGQQEEIRTLQGVINWLTRLMKDIKNPLTTLEESIKSLEAAQEKTSQAARQSFVNTIRESASRLDNIVEMTESIILTTLPPVRTVPEEINLKDYLDWVCEQVKFQAEKRNITISIQVADDIEKLHLDGKSLAQSLLYLIEGEVQSADYKDKLYIKVSAPAGQSINIEISNPNRQVPQQVIDQLLQGQPVSSSHDIRLSRIYLAKILVQGLDGNLEVSSENGQGITYTIIIPQSWQGSMQEVNALVLATDISRKHARAEIKKLQNLAASLNGDLPENVLNCFDTLRHRVQELGILCNRSLYLVEEYRSQMEVRQDGWLQREIEQVHTVEALVGMCEEIARPLASGRLFDFDSASRVARNALAVATEFKLSLDERQALWHASLLKDLGLVLSTRALVDHGYVATAGEANAVKARFKPVWKAFSAIDFMKTPLALISYSYEKYDDGACPSGGNVTEIPLGARILAVVRAFDALTSSQTPPGTKAPKMALQEIVRGSGTIYDPDVINAFLLYGRDRNYFKPQSNPVRRNVS